jgi:DNA-binding transcriptional regulator YdaS (Cro superfamily)
MTDALHIIRMTRGAATAVAASLGVTRAAVSQWAKAGQIPPKRAEAVERALNSFMAAQHGGPVASKSDAPPPEAA